jgi:predicted GIY-YIG superfamily endonuclease
MKIILPFSYKERNACPFLNLICKYPFVIKTTKGENKMIEKISWSTNNHLNSVELEFVKVTAETPVREIPKEPGIYMVFGKQGEILYGGESKDLRVRVRQHFNGSFKARLYQHRISHIMYAVFMADRYERTAVEGMLVSRYSPIFNYTDKDMMDSHGHEVEEAPKRSQKHLTKSEFFKIRHLVTKTSKSLTEIGEMYGVSYHTVRNIKNLHSNKFLRWEQERLVRIAS